MLALGAVGCKKKTKTAPAPAPVVAKDAPGAAGSNPDLNDEDGEDGERGAPAKPPSARSDAQTAAATRARLGALELMDPTQAAKNVGKPKVVVKKDAKGGCGEIKVGGRTYKMDCDTENYAKVKTASKPILSEDEMGVGTPVKLPSVVDFREKNLVGPVMDQGQTLTCTAVSLAAVVNHELAVKGKPAQVSPMHIWARYADPNMDEAIQTNTGKSIVPLALLPYDWKTADKWDKTKPPPADLVQKLDDKSIVKITDVTQIPLKDIKGTLAQGHAIWFGLAAGHYLQKTGGKPGGPQVIPAYDWHTVPANQQMGHALALMGYLTGKSGKTYYLIQNSWGDDWGDKGYAYIDEDTFARNMKAAYTVDITPTGAGKPVMGGAPPTKCKPGLLPDASTGKCAAACSDGSARDDGSCAETGECDEGEVNVKGKCVRAAPTLSTSKENYAIKCVPGGCLYGFKKGTAGCTKDNGCVFSCAAPTFKLVNTTSGLRCH